MSSKLKRDLSLIEVTLMGVGIIVGAGIYALVGKATGIAGDSVWLSFIISALVASFTGLSYAELSSMFPKDGAEYEYTKKAFNKRIAFIIGIMIIFSGIIASTAVALGFAGYFSTLFSVPIVLTAIVLMFLFFILLTLGVKISSSVAIIFTVLEVIGLLIIIYVGLPLIGNAKFEIVNIPSIFSAAALIFFAFTGFEAIVRLSEETKNPTKTIPKALLLSILITTILYILVAVSAISVLGWENLSNSKAPLAEVAAKALGSEAFLVLSVIALFSTANTVLLLLLSTSRIVYGMASSGSLPKILSHISKTRKTPVIATFVVCLLAAIPVFLNDISIAANASDFAIFVTFAVINLSVIKLRYTDKTKRIFKMPLNIGRMPILALLGLISSILLLFSLPLDVIFYGFVLIVISFITYEIVKKQF